MAPRSQEYCNKDILECQSRFMQKATSDEHREVAMVTDSPWCLEVQRRQPHPATRLLTPCFCTRTAIHLQAGSGRRMGKAAGALPRQAGRKARGCVGWRSESCVALEYLSRRSAFRAQLWRGVPEGASGSKSAYSICTLVIIHY